MWRMHLPTRSQDKMNRVAPDGKADWERIDTSKWNNWQKIAAKTHSVVTPANVIGIVGTALVLNGLQDITKGDYGTGAVKVVAGRLLDVLDGKVAHKTGTKSPLGATIDPTLDMIQLGFALPAFYQAEILPLVPAVLVAAPKAVSTVASPVAKLIRHKQIHVTGESKISTFATWAGVTVLVAKTAIEQVVNIPDVADKTLAIAGYGLLAAGVALGVPATIEYAKIAFTGYVQPAHPESITE